MHGMHTGFADPAFVAMQQNGYLSLKPNGKPFSRPEQ